ncbi:glycosyltransferase family A protein, partial [Neobacillus drentensis]|uniref:glycosyltransferase family 2 protein n=1 Tax=Neobacillus drentensis TaxID=220684 RepID=UPI002FFF8A23
MISVVIPMYNSKDTIERALDSIKNQTAFHEIGEIIVVNDGSKDNSLEIVKRYSESNKSMQIKIIDKENGGVSTARNAGLKMAQGEYIALLDSDDE